MNCCEELNHNTCAYTEQVVIPFEEIMFRIPSRDLEFWKMAMETMHSKIKQGDKWKQMLKLHKLLQSPNNNSKHLRCVYWYFLSKTPWFKWCCFGSPIISNCSSSPCSVISCPHDESVPIIAQSTYGVQFCFLLMFSSSTTTTTWFAWE